MSKARLRDNQAVVVKARDFEKTRHGKVVCFFCRCPVRGVPRTSRNRGNKQFEVAAYFGLPGRAETKGVGHKGSCPYNIGPTVEVIVAKSVELRNLDPDMEEMIARLNRGRIEFRLHILMKDLYPFHRTCKASQKSRDEDEGPSSATRYRVSQRKIRPYINIANSILILIARVRDKPALASWITLRYASHKMRWHHFFFNLKEHCKLYIYLAEKNVGNTRIPPIAVAIQLNTSWEPKETKYGTWQVPARYTECIDEKGSILNVRPTLYFKDEELAQELLIDRYVLVCGIPKLGKIWSDPENKDRPPRMDIAIEVVDRSQWCKYALDSTE